MTKGGDVEMRQRQLEAVRQAVRDFVLDNFYVPASDELGDEASLLEEGVADSTGLLEVIMFLEDTWGIVVEDAEMIPDHLDSIERIATFVVRKQRRSTGAPV